MAETIRETIEEFVKKQYESDLLEFAQERFDGNDRFSWSYHRPIEEYLLERLEVLNGDYSAMADIIREALASSEDEQVGWEGDTWDEDDILKDTKEYYLGDFIDEIEDGMFNGVPDTYRSLDTDELSDMLEKCPEWVDEYGDWDEE